MSFSINSISAQGSNGVSQQNMTSKLKSLGIPDEVISKGMSAVKEYASQNGISLPEPPKQNSGSESLFQNNKTDMKQELVSLGIPENIISQGQTAVKNYAQENGITLPEPPKNVKPQGAGANLDFSA